ncbi:hypothetical protein ACVXZY_15655 [Staphylococcus aureus]
MMVRSSFIPLQRVLMYFINPNDSMDQFTLEVLRLPRISCDFQQVPALGMSGLMFAKCIKKSNCST